MNEVVFDASVVLAVARNEPGAERVVSLRERAVISTVNATEVYAKLLAGGMSEREIGTGLQTIVRRTIAFDDAQMRSAAAIHAQTRAYGLSLADCACLALGRELSVAVYTADRKWSELSLGIAIEQVR